jgi:(2Fe-2S) ferredoxin
MTDPRTLPSPEEDAAGSPIIDHPLKHQVLVCTSKSCAANGSEAVLEAFKARLIEENLLFFKGNRAGEVQCSHCGSVGFCAIGPAVLVYPDGIWYAHVTPADVPEIIESHLKGGVPVERLVRKRLG